MPEEKVRIGGREFEVACQKGEEHYLHAAARLLDAEAQMMMDQIGRMPVERMLLMAGLMLADKTAGLEENLRVAEGARADSEAELTRLRDAPPPPPERVEVPVIPRQVLDALAELTARSEALADRTEDIAGVDAD